ncbi:MAG: IS607 family transposase [Aquificaceae bacterium]|nr:IS607 family transposase [Aquificaceae bacterium]
MHYILSMKLSDYAKKKGVSYRTAWRWFKAGYIKGEQLPTGTIIVYEEEKEKSQGDRCIIYARVSSKQRKEDLEIQVQRLKEYATKKGYQILTVVKEVASDVSDKRQGLINLLQRNDYDILLVEHKEKLLRFGFSYLKALLKKQGKRVEVMDSSGEDRQNLIEDLVSVIYSFSIKLHGPRKAKEIVEKIRKELFSDIKSE